MTSWPKGGGGQWFCDASAKSLVKKCPNLRDVIYGWQIFILSGILKTADSIVDQKLPNEFMNLTYKIRAIFEQTA